jgi:hypothetical protein
MTRLSLAVAVLAAAVALSLTGSARAERQDDGIIPRRAHAALVRFDIGAAGQTYGLGYARTWLGEDAPMWWALGVTTSATRVPDKGFQAGQVMALARGAIGHAPPVGAEVGLGCGLGPEGPQGIAEVGAFVTAYYVDLGYSFTFPLGPFERPSWLASHQFSLRGTIPFLRK